MATAARDYQATAGYRDRTSDIDVSSGTGWIGFAAVMLGFAGLWNTMNGILAIANSRVYAADAVYIFSDLNTWGWIITALGALQLIAASAVLTGSELARWFGIVVAGVNAMGQLYFLPAYPFWALSIFAVDILIIYGLVAYGGRRVKEA
jgi:hypothetical protein